VHFNPNPDPYIQILFNLRRLEKISEKTKLNKLVSALKYYLLMIMSVISML